MTNCWIGIDLFYYVDSVNWIPNLATIGNLIGGCLAIVLLYTDRPRLALFAMLSCLIFDFLDGFLARLLNAHHPWGKDLDSLADMVSFGVVPGLIAHKLASQSGPEWLAITSLIFPAMAAIRLARYNQDTESSDWFQGLPSPAAAAGVMGLLAIDAYDYFPLVNSLFTGQVSVLVFTYLFAFLMVTSWPHFHPKAIRKNGKLNREMLLLLVSALVAIIFLKEAAITSIVVLYILLSLINYSQSATKIT